MTKKIFFTPGPSQLHYSFEYYMKKAMDESIGSISHRSGTFQKIYQETEESLRTLLGLPDNFHLLFLSSATDIWERMLQNLVLESSHHFVNGAFSKRFYEFSQMLHKQSTCTEAAPGQEFDTFDIPNEAEVIAVTQNETSTGYAFANKRLSAIRDRYPDKLIAVDAVSSLPAVPLDFEEIDMTYFSVQKCFGLPAGLGVWLLNDRTIDHYRELSEKNTIPGTYRSLSSMLKQAEKHQTPETPNVLLIYLLGKVAQEMIQKGKGIVNDTIYKSTILYQCLENQDLLTPFVSNQANRSKTVIVAECEEVQDRLLKELADNGLVLGRGYGDFKEKHIRIANFPAHSREQVEMLCDLLQRFE